VGARQRLKPEVFFPYGYAGTVAGLQSLPLDRTDHAMRARLFAMVTTTTFLTARESSASSDTLIGARSRFTRSMAALALG